jgi:hypothetical protein
MLICDYRYHSDPRQPETPSFLVPTQPISTRSAVTDACRPFQLHGPACIVLSILLVGHVLIGAQDQNGEYMPSRFQALRIDIRVPPTFA